MRNTAAWAALAALAAMTSACASFSVTDDAIERNTAQALGLAKGTFTVTDRSNDGVKASYMVRTDSGVTRIWLPSAGPDLTACTPRRPAPPGLLSTNTVGA